MPAGASAGCTAASFPRCCHSHRRTQRVCLHTSASDNPLLYCYAFSHDAEISSIFEEHDMTLKQDTRASVLARRKAIPDHERKEKSLLICERFLAEVENRFAGETPSCASAKQLRIAAYEPMSSEVDVHPLLFAAYERGWEVFLPCMAKDMPCLLYTSSTAAARRTIRICRTTRRRRRRARRLPL